MSGLFRNLSVAFALNTVICSIGFGMQASSSQAMVSQSSSASTSHSSRSDRSLVREFTQWLREQGEFVAMSPEHQASILQTLDIAEDCFVVSRVRDAAAFNLTVRELGFDSKLADELSTRFRLAHLDLIPPVAQADVLPLSNFATQFASISVGDDEKVSSEEAKHTHIGAVTSSLLAANTMRDVAPAEVRWLLAEVGRLGKAYQLLMLDNRLLTQECKRATDQAQALGVELEARDRLSNAKIAKLVEENKRLVTANDQLTKQLAEALSNTKRYDEEEVKLASEAAKKEAAEEAVQCSICATSKKDRVFMCGHGICHGCLEQLEKSASSSRMHMGLRVIKCPACRQWTYKNQIRNLFI